MTTGSSRENQSSTGLLIVVAALVVVILGLGGVVVFLQLRPADVPETAAERDLMVWEEIADENPDTAWALTGLGLAQLASGDKAAAVDSFNEAIELNPEEWSAILELGKIRMAEDPDEAVTLLERAGTLAPRKEKATIYIVLGDLLLSQDDPAGARTAYETSISDLPFIFDSQYGLAVALEQLGETEAAIAQYQRAQDFDPTNPDVIEALARLGVEIDTP